MAKKKKKKPGKFHRGDLVFWKAPGRQKFWGIVGRVTKNECYLITASSGFPVPRGMVEHATIEQVIRYNRRVWGHSAARTRHNVDLAEGFVASMRRRR